MLLVAIESPVLDQTVLVRTVTGRQGLVAQYNNVAVTVGGLRRGGRPHAVAWSA